MEVQGGLGNKDGFHCGAGQTWAGENSIEPQTLLLSEPPARQRKNQGNRLHVDLISEFEVEEQSGGQTDCSFLVLYHTTRTFVIQPDDVIERVNSNRVEFLPALDIKVTLSDAF